MSRYKAYPAYKESGVEWLGRVPEHWSVKRLKQIIDPLRQITYGIVQAGPDTPDGIPYIRPTDMSDELGVNDFLEILRTTKDIADNYSRSSIKSGDLVCSIGPSFGKVMVVPEELDGANLTQGTARIAVASPNVSRFVFWVLRSSNSFHQWDSSIAGATFRALNLGPLAETGLSLPALAEQLTIATHLDRETTRIDGLVEKKTRFIELLREKRQALITHAVTKGLDPNAKMKDSGVEWLGEVPEHWESLPLRRIAYAVQTGGTPSAALLDGDSDDGLLWYTPGDFGSDLRLAHSARKFPLDTAEVESGIRIFPEGSVLIVSIGATLGKVGLAMTPCSANQQINAVLPDSKILGVFLAYSLSVKQDAMRFFSNASTIGIMNQDRTKEIPIAVPPLQEQAAIATHLDRETTRIDSLIAKTERSIELLKERRSALITAAVTGQIDLRDAA